MSKKDERKTEETSKDDLLRTSPEGAIDVDAGELSDDAVDRIAGGKGKLKTADKAYDAMDGYIRG